MQATVETISNLERRLVVAIPLQPINEEVGERLKRMARSVKMSGFRPGKVPMNIVKQQYEAQVRDEVIGNTVERTFTEAVNENKLRVAGYPSIQPKEASSADSLEYVATFEVFPEIALGDVAAIHVDRPVLEVSDAEIDQTIEVLRKQRATYEAVKRAAKTEDQVNIDLRASMDGEEVESTNPGGVDLVLGDKGRVPEFDEQLVGLKAGATKTFDITYSENHPNPKLINKTVTYEVTVNSVAGPKLPAVDAEFAKLLGVEDGDIVKMRADIKESLQQEVAKRIRAKVKEQVFDALVKSTAVDLPKSLLSLEMERLLQSAKSGLQQRGVDPATVNLEPGIFAEQAGRNVHLRLILGDIVTKHDLQAQPDQVRAMVNEFARSFEQPDEVVRWYYADPSRLDEPVGLATEENVITWVLERAKVNDQAIQFDTLMGKA